jgi:hypothetical protein
MAISLDKIEAMAPDQPSLAAATKIKASAWPVLAQNAAHGFAWGECQGSGSTPYRVSLALDDLGYKCSCPSRKFPCKHSLALMLLYARTPQAFAEAAIPDWVGDWASRRRPKSSAKPEADGGPRASLDAVTESEPEKAVDEKALIRAAQQRERLKAEREASIISGLDELDLWITDRLNRGIAGFINDAAQQCRIVAQRLVDAKAPALAARIDGLPAEILALPEKVRPDAVIEALGSFHLLAAAYRRQDKLPEALRHDIRRLIGWSQERQALLEDASSPRVAGKWIVIATNVEIQPDKLRRIETWLAGERDGEAVYAVLIDFVPLATGAGGSPYLPGEAFEAELVFYPSAVPLRALLNKRGDDSSDIRLPAKSLAEALHAYDSLRVKHPWLGQVPMTVKGAEMVRFTEDGLWLIDGDDGMALHPSQQDEALVLADIPPAEITGLWDGRYFTAVMAETSLGRWIR